MKKANYVISALAIIIGIVFLVVGHSMPVFSLDGITDSTTWPDILSIVLIGLGVLLAVVNTVSKKIPGGPIDYKSKDFKNLIIFAVILAIYGVLFYLLGCLISTAIFVPVALIFVGQRSWKFIVIYDAALLVGLYVLFELVLKSPLAKPIFMM